MLNHIKTAAQRHIKTHTERSVEDIAAVTTIKSFFKGDGRIIPDFSEMDKWPNADGTFEFVIDPSISRQPEQSFFVQIKGTKNYTENDGVIKYSLRDLAFPAFICNGVTLDPGILFVVLNPTVRSHERILWKYISVDFLNSIDFNKDSTTITFTSGEEIFNTDESIDTFCESLEKITKHHSFVSKLDETEYTKDEIERIIFACDEQITEAIDRLELFNSTRDDVSKRILNRLNDLCLSTLLLNTMSSGFEHANLQLAWERSLLSIDTKYLATFLRGLKYIGHRVPADGQSERLMLKYHDFLWQIRKYLKSNYNYSILQNLEKFPLDLDEVDTQYYELVATAISETHLNPNPLTTSKYYVQKSTPFFIGSERYYEITLQLAGIYATKYNRITAYTKESISTSYPVKIGYTEATIDLWGVPSRIKLITNWCVAIEPSCLNKLAKILRISSKLNSNYGEYRALMDFLTKTGMNLLDMIDLKEVAFFDLLDDIYKATNTAAFKEVLIALHNSFSQDSTIKGRNVVRYLLLNLRAETIESVLPSSYYSNKQLSDALYISSQCFPFEKNPFISNLVGRKTTENHLAEHIVRVAGRRKMEIARPYLALKNATKYTGEIYFEEDEIADSEVINNYNIRLDSWERSKGFGIVQEDGLVCINHYEQTTLYILRELVKLSKIGNKGQKEFNQRFLKNCGIDFNDPLKKKALTEIFVDSQILLIYGAAGTGKTTLINYISNMMNGQKKLFLSKTHTALQNLRRRIDNPGADSEFISLNSFNKKVHLPDFDVIFVDECSTIDNRAMATFLQNINPNAFLVLAGDIHQIESIEFGNWFHYAKDIIKGRGASIELLSTWRTQDQKLIGLWNEVRTKNPLITEHLAIDGPYSEDIGPSLLTQVNPDEVVLCLNYDGKFGLNNINNYFQNANTLGPPVSWCEWTYKIGDRILFNENKRFSVLYNNLKGRIVDIQKDCDCITFTVDVETNITEKDCQRENLEFIDAFEASTRIRFSVYLYDGNTGEEDEEEAQMNSIIPFQLAYAVSIHKAQGLEFDSVKVVIPSVNAERITHGIFYTAITRAKKNLKIYWSTETMQEIVKGFSEDDSKRRSLEIVKTKLSLTQSS